jgi:type I restriction-modification system DNA methylase subunit
MEQGPLNWITNFIWGIADDVLRDLYVRGKYRDVILPMTVLRRLDAVLEPTKQAVLDLKASLDAAEIVHQDPALRQAAGGRPGLLQHLQVHSARSPGSGQPAETAGRLRGLPRWLLAQGLVCG